LKISLHSDQKHNQNGFHHNNHHRRVHKDRDDDDDDDDDDEDNHGAQPDVAHDNQSQQQLFRDCTTVVDMEFLVPLQKCQDTFLDASIILSESNRMKLFISITDITLPLQRHQQMILPVQVFLSKFVEQSNLKSITKTLPSLHASLYTGSYLFASFLHPFLVFFYFLFFFCPIRISFFYQ